MQKFYNLDAVISVGYRVNSIRGVRFRQWATKEVVALFNFFSRKERKVRKGVGMGRWVSARPLAAPSGGMLSMDVWSFAYAPPADYIDESIVDMLRDYAL